MWVVLFYLIYSTLHDIQAPSYVKDWKQMLVFVPLFKLIGIYLLSAYRRNWPALQPIDRYLILSTLSYSLSSSLTYLTFNYYNISALEYSILTKSKIFWCILFSNPSPLRLSISMFSFAGLLYNNYPMVKIMLSFKSIFSALGSVFSAKYILFGEEADFQHVLNRIYTFTLASIAWSFLKTFGMYMSFKSVHFVFDGTIFFCILDAINSLLIAFVLSTQGPVIRESLNSFKDLIFMLSEKRFSFTLFLVNVISSYFLVGIKNIKHSRKLEQIDEEKIEHTDEETPDEEIVYTRNSDERE